MIYGCTPPILSMYINGRNREEPMAFFRNEERCLAGAVRGFIEGNPFLPDRIEHEKAVLGADFRAEGADWNLHPERAADHPNLVLVGASEMYEARCREHHDVPGRPT